MVLRPSHTRTQEPSDPSSDCQSCVPLLARMHNSYRLQQQGTEDRFSDDVNRFQEDSGQRSLDGNGYLKLPKDPPPYYSGCATPIDTSDLGSSEIANADVQSIHAKPGVPHNPRPPKAVLKRGLQIPTRISYITSGFQLPPTLCDAGVDRARWKAFTREVKACGSMSKSQWASVIGCSLALGLLVDFFILPGAGQLVVAPLHGHKKRKTQERANFRDTFDTGGLQLVAEKWNRDLFEPLGLQVRIEPPEYFRPRDMSTMDVSSTKLFKYQEKKGVYPSSTGGLSKSADKKAVKYARKEGKYRTKAARKGRILISPIEPETLQAEVDESAAVSSKGCIGQLDGRCTCRSKNGQQSSSPVTGYTTLPAAGPSPALHTLELCAAVARLAVAGHAAVEAFT